MTNEDVRRSKDYNLECGRCGNHDYLLFKNYRAFDGSTDDWEDQPIPEELLEEIWLCQDCSWEVMNGYPMEMDAVEIGLDREERAYEEDPINNDPPWLERIQ